MKVIGWIAAGAVTGLLALPAAALADDAPAEPSKTIDQRVADLEKSLGALSNISIGGMLYGSYLYNFNDPDNRENQVRSLDNKDNTITVDLFQLNIGKEGPDGLSVATKLDFGNTASRIGADWSGDGNFTGVTGDNGDFEIEEAYLNYAPDWSHGVSAKFGKFVTLLGAEVIEAPLDMNYSRSFLFGYAIPFTHTGLLFNIPLTDTLQTNLGVVNGWDNVVDNNNAKTFLGNLAWTANDHFSVAAAGTYGGEQTDKSGNPRGVADLVSTITFDPLTVSLNGDYGHENGAAVDGGSASWYGFSGILGLDLKEIIQLPTGLYFRGEWFDDDGGSRTGISQKLWEVTITGKYFVTEHFTIWTEYRHDDSNQDPFDKSGTISVVDATTGEITTEPRVTNTQDTVAIAASYTF